MSVWHEVCNIDDEDNEMPPLPGRYLVAQSVRGGGFYLTTIASWDVMAKWDTDGFWLAEGTGENISKIVYAWAELPIWKGPKNGE
jgi:hypothetical protein